jgi:serine/threonine protein kinase
LTSSGDLKLGDFGACKKVYEIGEKSIAGTPAFMAPEILDESAYCEAADMWSLGVSFAELLLRILHEGGNDVVSPLSLGSQRDIDKWVCEVEQALVGTPESSFFLALFQGCLRIDPSQRTLSSDMHTAFVHMTNYKE